MTNVWFATPAACTTRSIFALPVKWGTLNLPPLIVSTSGRVDQIKCLTPESLAARIAAVACLSSSAPPYAQKLVTKKTPCAPSNAALSVSGLSKSAARTSSAISRCLSGLRVSARTLNCPLAWRARTTPPPWCPVAPITAISFSLLDNTFDTPFHPSIIQESIAPMPRAADRFRTHDFLFLAQALGPITPPLLQLLFWLAVQYCRLSLLSMPCSSPFENGRMS